MSVLLWIILGVLIGALCYVSYRYGAYQEARWWRADLRRRAGLPPEEKK